MVGWGCEGHAGWVLCVGGCCVCVCGGGGGVALGLRAGVGVLCSTCQWV
jgi:hypothetical protein